METYGRGLAVQRRLAEAYPAVARFQSDLARSQFNLAFLLGRTGEPAKALELHNQSLAIRRRLVDSNPDVTQFQFELAASHDGLGVLFLNTGEPAKR